MGKEVSGPPCAKPLRAQSQTVESEANGSVTRTSDSSQGYLSQEENLKERDHAEIPPLLTTHRCLSEFSLSPTAAAAVSNRRGASDGQQQDEAASREAVATARNTCVRTRRQRKRRLTLSRFSDSFELSRSKRSDMSGRS